MLRKILIILTALLLAPVAHAQVLPAPVQYVVSPETPGPNQNVTIEAQGVGTFMGSANITWQQDGKVVKQGVGERSYTFTTGGLGARTTIKVTINSSQGTFTQTFIFNPTKVNLVWEANTTIPPLYKGKALYSAGSSYKVIAYPTVFNGSTRIAQSALTYQWSYKGDFVPEKSGLGRYTFSTSGDQLQASENIGVDVYYGASKLGHADVVIPTSDPKILFYEYNASRGTIYDVALPAAIELVGQELSLKAEPYFFATDTKNAGAIPYVWTLNGEETTGPDAVRGILTLRQTGAGSGSATIGVSMQNNSVNQLVQAASASLQLVFGGSQNSQSLNLFGI